MSLYYESLHDGIVRALESQDELNRGITRFMEVVNEQFEQEERIIAELRDDLHTLANRLEALTRAAS